MSNKSVDLLKRVNDSINHIRPFLQSDGGDIEVVEITRGMVVKVRLLGSCGCCPFNLQTLKAGVEQTLRREIPEIMEVIAIE